MSGKILVATPCDLVWHHLKWILTLQDCDRRRSLTTPSELTGSVLCHYEHKVSFSKVATELEAN